MILRLAQSHLTMTVQAGVQGSQQLLSGGSQKPQNKGKDNGAAQGQGQCPERPRRANSANLQSKNTPESASKSLRRRASFPQRGHVWDSQLPFSAFPPHLSPRPESSRHILGGLSPLCLLTPTLVSPETPQTTLRHWFCYFSRHLG